MDDERLRRKQQKKAEKLAKLQTKQQSREQQPAGRRETRQREGAKGYDPSGVERHWVSRWKEERSFLPVRGEGERFCMVIPPPNITGSLHIGHAMMIAIEDSIVRYKRLTGHEVLYLPGLDHAGIATQSVVLRSTGDVGREEFMEAAFAWSERYGSRICEQLDRMGCSLDYTRKTFTLDPRVSRAVNAAFVELHRRGLVYRDKKIVNWCGKLRTTLSDLEVNHREVRGGAHVDVDGGSYVFGMMYYIRYYLEPEGGDCGGTRPFVVIGTTRPETILGDVAVCVNPDDPRFADIGAIFRRGEVPDVLNTGSRRAAKEGAAQPDILDTLDGLAISEEMKAERRSRYRAVRTAEAPGRASGIFAVNPLTGRRMPVIFDAEADIAFGTGMLKVTPAHDAVDFRLGKRHGLEFVSIMDENNRITGDSVYCGMGRFEARKKILADLGDGVVSAERHDQVLPFCSRTGDIVEPVVRDQWWMDCRGMAEKAIEGVRSGDIKMFPEEAKAVWYRWLENIRDWCLSRQLWWGHRVPAWRAYREAGGDFEWVVAEDGAEALEAAKRRGFARVEQDEDVLDTWFSSGLWPFSTLGWPDRTEDLARYFPNSLLETGSDILFFWVARMVMLSYELCGTRPFDAVLLHGIVRDSHGRKMSKSLGNVVDPTSVIDGVTLKEMVDGLSRGNLDPREARRAADALRRDFPDGIPRCGADALRFALLSYSNGMRDINLDILRVKGYSRLCNKMYNAYNFMQTRYGAISADELCIRTEALEQHQKWILHKLNVLIAEQHACFRTYNFMLGTQSIHAFFLHDFCDVALEVSKHRTDGGDGSVLGHVFSSVLRLFHPYMPFITEDLHTKLFGTRVSAYPCAVETDLANVFEDVVAVARLCRSQSICVQRFPGDVYLSALVRGGVALVDSIDGECQTVGGIRYRGV